MQINAITQPISSELRKVENSKKAEKEGKVRGQTVDRSDISADAQHLNASKAQFNTISTAVSLQSDVRAEKVAEVKQKIESGYYNSDEFIDKLADKLLNEFGITG